MSGQQLNIVDCDFYVGIFSLLISLYVCLSVCASFVDTRPAVLLQLNCYPTDCIAINTSVYMVVIIAMTSSQSSPS